MLLGHYQYYGVPLNAKALQQFRKEVSHVWQRSLSRRGQKGYVSWARMSRYVAYMAPGSPYLSSVSERAFWREDLRQEPSAVVPLAGICAGGAW